MIISVEYENGILKVTPPLVLPPAMGKKLAEAVLYAANEIQDGRDPFPDQDDEDRLEELKGKIRDIISDLQDLV